VNACGAFTGENEYLGRQKRDGCVLVGSDSAQETLQNDIVIPDDGESGLGRRHFIIKYSPDHMSYYLRDLGDGNGTFVRLDTPLLLKHGFIISFGDSHMVVSIFKDDEPRIQLKFLDGPKIDQTFGFKHTYGQIKIGRMSDCDV
jgi:pSer/pThr/pTyr-binding forkhead associated (FHA) protein